MPKRVITSVPPDARFERDHPIDVSTAALVEVTSEDNDHPIEAALIPGELKGWRAAEPGTQTIRLIFDQPKQIKRISLVFEEKETNRTQEFVLRWSPNPKSALREIVRQRWNFSPPHTTTEVEEYRVELSDVTLLEMTITLTLSVAVRFAHRSIAWPYIDQGCNAGVSESMKFFANCANPKVILRLAACATLCR